MPPRTKAYLNSLSIPSPALLSALKKDPRFTNPPNLSSLSYQDLRAHRAAILREKWPLRYLPGPIPEVLERDLRIPVRNGAEITIRIYTPVNTKPGGEDESRPLIVMFHEGGWGMGDLSDEEVNCRLFSRDLGAVCVNVEYRLAPEYPFPTWIEDAWDALVWCAEHTLELGVELEKGFVVGGGSAGGNIAAVLAVRARDRGVGWKLSGQYLCVPAITCFLPPSHIPSKYRNEYLSHPLVTPSSDPILKLIPHLGPLFTPLTLFFRALLYPLPLSLLVPIYRRLGFHAPISSPLFVPFLNHSTEQGFKGLPPAYFQVCGLDPLRDEGLIYERILREESGVETRLDVYPGVGHYFWTNFPEMEGSRAFVEDSVRGVGWLLGRK
ncbi:alpha/beta-Hydrolase [Glarea lozoyensis ATCC 20868]|uniref:Alpha/beta-Hydrolase n=2 Tax=Glarea lozoyensis TaxID=101852 RepID=S3E6G9_GLAL2|nr:alpha/beta-Hydrolase [Glarea lozoyensis ATCC 20868]EHL01750.1 putative AB hydrolase superfamily protein B1A11.02 [Glarea lozoyensis 74030]EPE33973.1 alpha/beta-Hydrolase [Glarea lozoyensis ATCC 20868]